MNSSVITFNSQGDGHCLYTEAVDLSSIGPLQMERASTIEFSEQDQEWEVRGPEGNLLFSNKSRLICLDWEQQFFNR